MTIETGVDAGSIIVQNLERRFSVLEQCKDPHNFSEAEREYVNYLEDENRLHSALKVFSADKKYYDVMTRIIFVLSMPSGKPYHIVESSLSTIKIPSFLKGSEFENIPSETIKAAEFERRKTTQEAVSDEVVGCGSRERAHTIATEIIHQRLLSPFRKLHLALVNRLTNEASPTPHPITPKRESDTGDHLSRQLTSDGVLNFNKRTGVGRINKMDFSLHPESQEANALWLLLSDSDGLALFDNLLGKENAKKASERRKLSFVIRNLRKDLGILPRKKAKNKNVIVSVKRMGYRLLIQPASQSKHNQATKKP